MDKNTIMKWAYRVFSYIVPSGIALWTMLIENMISKETSVMSKVTGAGIFALVVIVLISVFFFGRFLKKKQQAIVDEIIICTDDAKKLELIEKKAKVEKAQDVFANICFVAPFVVLWIVCGSIEKGVVSLRGTLMAISVSMLTGLGINITRKK